VGFRGGEWLVRGLSRANAVLWVISVKSCGFESWGGRRVYMLRVEFVEGQRLR
jgi:hypothetical protein